MKLDRNTNSDGIGKYALIRMRHFHRDHGTNPAVYEAFKTLCDAGLVEMGNESPEEQFFVMKYKDRFTHHALKAYADAATDYSFELMGENIDGSELREFAGEVRQESHKAREIGHKIPD